MTRPGSDPRPGAACFPPAASARAPAATVGIPTAVYRREVSPTAGRHWRAAALWDPHARGLEAPASNSSRPRAWRARSGSARDGSFAGAESLSVPAARFSTGKAAARALRGMTGGKWRPSASRRVAAGPAFLARGMAAQSGGEEDKGPQQTTAEPVQGLMERVTARLVAVFGGDKERASASGPGVRWAMMAPAFLTHMCIGHPYAWSVMSSPLTRELGVVAASAADWSLAQATLPISLVFAAQGVAAAVAGPWLANIGPRASMMIAAACFSGGLGLSALGVAMHSLPLLYLGYGVLGGTGVGLGYTPPIQTLISWFPDRRGLASGVTIAGFGSGALVFAPAAQWLMAKFQQPPEFAGSPSTTALVEKDGLTFVSEAGGKLREVVEATSASLAEAGLATLDAGYYYVGTGTTGVAESLAVFGGAYGAIMAASALAIRTPWRGFDPAQFDKAPAADAAGAAGSDSKPAPAAGATAAPLGNVNPATVLRTPQFWMLGTTFFAVAAGGIALLSVAKPLVRDVFVSSGAATAGFASTFLLLLSAGNLAGRLGWAAFSDKVGRRNTFILFTAGSIPLYLTAPWLVSQVIENNSTAALATFAASCTLAISFMGGTYALLPAYESDLFGTKHVGANHGRMLLASTAAAMAGPSALMALRERASSAAIDDLLTKADPAAFADRFRAPIEDAGRLLEAKRLTLSSLLEVCPPGTPDPTPFLYDSTMHTMAGVMVAATAAHLLVRPVNPKFFEEQQATARALEAEAAATAAAGDKPAEGTPAEGTPAEGKAAPATAQSENKSA